MFAGQLTVGGVVSPILTTIELLVAVLVVAQATLLVSTHFTDWPLVIELVVNVALLVPAFTPSNVH
jgi:hypothetical protein